MHRALKTCHRVRWTHHHLCTFKRRECLHSVIVRAFEPRFFNQTRCAVVHKHHQFTHRIVTHHRAHIARARAMGAHARGRFVAVKTRLSNPSARGYVFLFKSSSSRERFPPRGFHRPSSSSSSSSHTRRRPRRPRRPRRRAHTPRAKTRSQNASSYAPQHFFN